MGWIRKRRDAEGVYYSAHHTGMDGRIRTESGYPTKAAAQDALDDAEATLDQPSAADHDSPSRQG